MRSRSPMQARKVALVARADREGLEETAALARAKGVRAEVILADITDEISIRDMVGAVKATFGRLDVLVNNAALRAETPIEEITSAEWRKVLAVNLDAAFFTVQAALPLLKASDAGAIINIGGLTAYTGAKNRPHVVAAKAGLDGLTKALAQDLADAQITVNLVSPGLIATQRGGSSPVEPEHHKKHTTLLGRRGQPEEVAAMVRHCRSERTLHHRPDHPRERRRVFAVARHCERSEAIQLAAAA